MGAVTTGGNGVELTDSRLVRTLQSAEVDIGVLWEVCLAQEFDRAETVRGIVDWLGAPEGQRILDCACGSGFPALDLAKAGYDLTCSDGSDAMLAHFRENARLMGADVEPHLVTWERLTDVFRPESFDVVMCRGGGSYLYAGTWDADGRPDRSALPRILGQFAQCLKPGGRLYIDITRAEALVSPVSLWQQSPSLQVDGRRIDLTQLITIDRERGTRTWHSRLVIDDKAYQFERTSHLLSHNELLELLAQTGLRNIRPVDVVGESYDVYVAERAG